MVHDIDVAVCEGDFSKLCQVFGIQERNFGMLLNDSSCRADAIDQADEGTDQADTGRLSVVVHRQACLSHDHQHTMYSRVYIICYV